MSAIFDAYDLPIERLVDLYLKLNRVIPFPDGTTTTLGVIYWGREGHLLEIERSIPILAQLGILRLSDFLMAVRTPLKAHQFVEESGIPGGIVRILAHDIDLWLPQSVPLDRWRWFREQVDCLARCTANGFKDQLDIISAGQTRELREGIARQTRISPALIKEMVQVCDFYRTGRNLEHIRSRIYYDMGVDTLEKLAAQTSEEMIALFTQYLREHNQLEARLVPWPKEVRNGIEWAKMHLEMYAVKWEL